MRPARTKNGTADEGENDADGNGNTSNNANLIGHLNSENPSVTGP